MLKLIKRILSRTERIEKLLEEITRETDRLRYLAGDGRLTPEDFDGLMTLLGGTTWAQENGRA